MNPVQSTNTLQSPARSVTGDRKGSVDGAADAQPPRASFCAQAGGALRTFCSYGCEAMRTFAPQVASLQFGAVRYTALNMLIETYNSAVSAEEQVKPGDGMYHVLDYAVTLLAWSSYQGVFGAAHATADAAVSLLRDAINYGASRIGDFPLEDSKGTPADPLLKVPGGPAAIDRAQLTAVTFGAGAGINAGLGVMRAVQGASRPPSLIASRFAEEYGGGLAAVAGLILSTAAPARDRPLVAPTPLTQLGKWLGEKWGLMKGRMLALDDVEFRSRMGVVPTVLLQAALPALAMPLALWAAGEQNEEVAEVVHVMTGVMAGVLQFALFQNLATEWGVGQMARTLPDEKFNALRESQADHPRRAAMLERVAAEREENLADPRQDAFEFNKHLYKQFTAALFSAIYLQTVFNGVQSSDDREPADWGTGLALGAAASAAMVTLAHVLTAPKNGQDQYAATMLGSTAAAMALAGISSVRPEWAGPLALGSAVVAAAEPIVSRVMAEDLPQPQPPVVLEDARPAALPEALIPEVDLERGDAGHVPSHEQAPDGRGDHKRPTSRSGSDSASDSDHSPVHAWGLGPGQGMVPPKSVSRPVTPSRDSQQPDLPGSLHRPHDPLGPSFHQGSRRKYPAPPMRQPDFRTPHPRTIDDSSVAPVTIHHVKRKSPLTPKPSSTQPLARSEGRGVPLTPAVKVDAAAPD